MDKSSKFLALISLVIVFLGLSLLWFGFQTPNLTRPIPTPPPNNLQSNESSQSSVLNLGVDRVLVTKVVDGDTIKIEGDLTIRLIGIDTPETVDPRRPVGCFGKEASNELKSLIEGKEVVLERDTSDTDKYQRLLRYIYLPLENGKSLFVNDYMVRQGFAFALTYPPDVRYEEKFREGEKEAKMGNRGLWGRC